MTGKLEFYDWQIRVRELESLRVYLNIESFMTGKLESES